MTEADVASIVSDVLRRHFPWGEYESADVRFDADFDGEPIIRVTAHYRTRPASRVEMIGAVHDIRDSLIARGDERFVFLTHDIADERQTFADVD